MYVIAKAKDGYQAIPIRSGDSWEFYKVQAGQREQRIVLRVRGRRYILYTTQELTSKYPFLCQEQLTPLCDDIIDVVRSRICNSQEYIDVIKIAGAAECRHHRAWCLQGLISPSDPVAYWGYPIDTNTEQMIAHVRIDLSDLVLMDCEPPTDVEQEELPY